MKRRHFIQRAGLVAASIPAVAATANETPRPSQPDGRLASVLITSAHHPLAQVLAIGLREKYQVRLTSPADLGAGPLPFIRSPLNHGESCRTLVHGVDAIVHVAEPLAGATEAERTDYRTRATYNLLRAGTEAGVQVVIYLSSLAMMTAYDAEFNVDEDWRPRATVESGALSDYLGEFTCREFTRDGSLHVCVLRLGKVVRAQEVTGPWHPLAVDEQDVVQAVSLALAADLATPKPRLGPWSVFHILSASPQARFSIAKARRMLGYHPQWNG
jgi:hypothetical protein